MPWQGLPYWSSLDLNVTGNSRAGDQSASMQLLHGRRPLARETGLEPATSGVTGRRSNQLSYSRFGGREALGRQPACVKHEARAAPCGFW
jgi:hypothetical protein